MEERSQRILLISDAIAFTMYLYTWIDIDEDVSVLDDDTLKDFYKKWVDILRPSANQPHSGDCTNQPWTCLRCVFEQWEKDSLRIAYTIEEHKEHMNKDTFLEFPTVLRKQSEPIIDPKGFLGDD